VRASYSLDSGDVKAGLSVYAYLINLYFKSGE
jgi:hypothetical protein